ncbi:PilW family protein [Rhodoferax sp.]|uniref:PilW family protein n=1 Tax=Rhodoferax sp. TaxID=50421 RepID=UPI00276DBE79|nr:PilW family protein [Rhodoferax sp.]
MHKPNRFVDSSLAASQSGISLIELLIGITIGLLVVVAALGSLAFTQITSTTVGDSARLQQKANSAFRTIGYQLRQAGGIQLMQPVGTGVVSYSNQFNGWNGTGPNIAVTGVEGGGLPDTLRMSYEDDGASRDCLGNLATTTPLVRVDNEFSVVGGRLMCRGADGTFLALLDGVENFQVTYGVKSEVPALPAVPARFAPSNALGTALPYQPASATHQQFPANPAIFANPPFVQSVTICLQLRGDQAGDASAGGGTQGCNGFIANDGFIRRAFRNTYTLRGVLL